MKKLYRKGTVHPSPPIITDHLSFLPATILTLAAALSVEDREVLAYLISCSNNTNFSGNNNNNNNSRRNNTATTAAAVGDHAPLFNCSCFRCYTSYWARWDSSPNRQLIHEIIDAFEDWLSQQNKNKSGGKNSSKKRNNNTNNNNNKKNKKKELNDKINNSSELLTRTELVCSVSDVSSEFESVEDNNSSNINSEGVGDEDKVENEEEKGSVRRFVSFIGEKIWGAWGQ
ncbi:hypothetical protein RIF29_40782 [Crotalaria pallida]|uniref:Uncharacterized protein n=1 Tax=Crotalaria pallida TaxID=3830 RepID=A0AAN9HUL9_CROPI